MLYRLLVHALKTRPARVLWRLVQVARGRRIGSYAMLPSLIRRLAPGKSLVDVGCMWGVDGEYSFVAEAAGATRVVGIDVFGPTPEFLERQRSRGSRVEFVLGDAGEPEVVRRVGPADVVFCAGVLYHHPAPFDLLVALRSLCRETLLLRSSTIPEPIGARNMAVLWPYLPPGERRLWSLRRVGLDTQVGITGPFDPGEGYGNWFWGLSPSCLRSLLRLAGFEVVESYTEPFAQTVICRAAEVPFAHRLPSQEEAARLGAEISRSGRARPA